jgi:hypothetical protein
MYSDILPTFQRCLLGDDGGRKKLWNVGKLLSHNNTEDSHFQKKSKPKCFSSENFMAFFDKNELITVRFSYLWNSNEGQTLDIDSTWTLKYSKL